MERNERLYKISVSKVNENATVIATTHELIENSYIFLLN